MVKIDGNLTDATFKVKSDAVLNSESGGRLFVYCVEAYTPHDSCTIDYITETLAEYSKKEYNAKGNEELILNIEFNIDKKIGDII